MQLRRRPTMDDVAQAAGVSKATVSRVLAGMEGVCSEETARSVLETAKRLGYVVNSIAASLRSRQTFAVGLIIADVSNPFFGRLTSGAENRLSEAGYGVILGNSENSPERERQLVHLLIERRIDGIIAATSASSGEHLEAALASGIHVVLVNSEVPGIDVDMVTIDNHATAERGVSHLLEQGHRRIAIITGPLIASFDRDRLAGYFSALKKYGVEPSDHLVFKEDLTAEGGARAIEEMRDSPERPSAIFVTNNMMTLGALVGLKRAELTIPHDVSLVAFDDQDWYSVCTPPLTSIVNPAYEMGRRAADRLLLRLQRKRQPRPERIILASDMVVRSSTAAIQAPLPRKSRK